MKKSSFLILLLTPFLFFSCQTKKQQKIEQYSINQFMENTSVFGSSFSPDGKKILFTSNETGVYNAFEVNVEGGEPQQITNRQESTYGMSYFPDDERIMLTSDQGGNEINHLFVIRGLWTCLKFSFIPWNLPCSSKTKKVSITDQSLKIKNSWL